MSFRFWEKELVFGKSALLFGKQAVSFGKSHISERENGGIAGRPILTACVCYGCKDADFDTRTWKEDDMGYVICRDPECPEHKRHRNE